MTLRSKSKKKSFNVLSLRLIFIVEFEKSNESVRQEIRDMKARLRLDQLEEELRNLKATNA